MNYISWARSKMARISSSKTIVSASYQSCASQPTAPGALGQQWLASLLEIINGRTHLIKEAVHRPTMSTQTKVWMRPTAGMKQPLSSACRTLLVARVRLKYILRVQDYPRPSPTMPNFNAAAHHPYLCCCLLISCRPDITKRLRYSNELIAQLLRRA